MNNLQDTEDELIFSIILSRLTERESMLILTPDAKLQNRLQSCWRSYIAKRPWYEKLAIRLGLKKEMTPDTVLIGHVSNLENTRIASYKG